MGKDLQEITTLMHNFVSAKGWYQTDSIHPQTPKNIAISLVLEASEVLELFQWDKPTVNKDYLGSELADVALYLVQLSQLCDIDLEEVILKKLDQNYNREW